jgi:hypothetical protein
MFLLIERQIFGLIEAAVILVVRGIFSKLQFFPNVDSFPSQLDVLAVTASDALRAGAWRSGDLANPLISAWQLDG